MRRFVLAATLALLVACFGLSGLKVGSRAKLAVPRGWSQLQADPHGVELAKISRTGGRDVMLAHVVITTEDRRSHDEAVRRLAEIATETTAPGSFGLTGGWPAFHRRRTVPAPHLQAEGREAPNKEPPLTLVTIAIAAGDQLVRLEGSVPSIADPAVVQEIEQLAAALAFDDKPDPVAAAADVERLRRGIPAPVRTETRAARPPSLPAPPGSALAAPAPVAGTVGGEIELAASPDGRNVVVGFRFRLFSSNNGGVTFSQVALPVPTGGDPSVTVGASGAFYYAFIGSPNGSGAFGGVTGCAASVIGSTDLGKTFTFSGNAAFCPSTGNPQCFTDQEHIAADPVNMGPGKKDQLYVVWRYFTPWFGGNCPRANLNVPTPYITCSSNGGASWPVQQKLGAGDHPRVAVGGDGSVWAIYRSDNHIVLHKFSSCVNGLLPQKGFPVTVTDAQGPQCPLPGLDRCDPHSLSSPMVAVDPGDAQHLFVAYAVNTSTTNDNIMVIESRDGGVTWPPAVTVNTSGAARRFMPWVCTLGGTAHVGWYDRRAANAPGATNDLTDYFRGSASNVGGTLTAGTEVDVAGANDAQCATGWPCQMDDIGDAESCTVSQIDGKCLVTSVPSQMGSGAPCNFHSVGCSFPEMCFGLTNPNGGGCPKYGDYNGIACAGGHVFSAWASAAKPPSVPPASVGSGISIYVDALPCGSAGGPCCAAPAAACDATSVCRKQFCTHCGNVNEPCCTSGAACSTATLVCNSSQTCACGGAGQPCCNGTSCATGFACNATKVCECGQLGQPCCQQSVCSGTNLCDPVTSRCIRDCGRVGWSCCPGNVCNLGATCAGGTCACGGENQSCCLAGQSCQAGLICDSRICTSTTSDCGSCDSALSTCLSSCHTAACECVCRNASCRCKLNNGCGLCSFDSSC